LPHQRQPTISGNLRDYSDFPLPPEALPLTWWHIAEVAASQHFINAGNDRKNTLFLSTRGKAAILAICSLWAGFLLFSFFQIKHFSKIRLISIILL